MFEKIRGAKKQIYRLVRDDKKKAIGFIVGLGLTPLLYYFIRTASINTIHYAPRYLWNLVYYLPYYASVTISATIASFISLDWRIGVITGVVSGIYILPISVFFIIEGIHLEYFIYIVTSWAYRRAFGLFFSIAWIGATLGGITPAIVNKIQRLVRR